MLHGRRFSETARRAAERRQRENDAPRLKTVVPALSTLDISFAESARGTMSTHGHVRHVVVDRAPALFEQRCANPMCKEGLHDLTRVMLGALGQGVERIDGEDACPAPLVGGSCGWVLKYSATARYSHA